MTLAQGRVLLHLAGRRRRVVEADDIYYLEAQRDETDVRLRAARRLRDVRSLGEVLKEIGALGSSASTTTTPSTRGTSARSGPRGRVGRSASSRR